MPIITHNPITTGESDDFFDFTSKGLRASTFTFDVVEVITGMVVGTFHPIRGSVPTLAHDTTRSVKRTVTMVLNVADTETFDEITHRVNIAMVTGDGRTFPLGRYMAVNISRIPNTGGTLCSVALVDEMFMISQKITSSFTAAQTPGMIYRDGVGRSNTYNVINEFLSRFTLFNPSVGKGSITSGTTGATQEPRARIERFIEFSSFLSSGSWQAGTEGTSVLSDLATDGDYFTPWMDHHGNFRMIRTYNPDDVVPRFDFDEQKNVIRDSVTRANDLLNAPNRIIVVSNAGVADNRTNPIVGMYDIPPSAPHAIGRRGFVIPEIVDMQVMSIVQATAIARNIGQNQRVVDRVELATPPDPRHDSYDVVRFDGVLWLETAWTMSLIEGGEMRHSMQRIFL